ncbi:hypothetical protein HK104_002370, partial [Borealophlyctis nickersoniae]
DLSNNGLTGFPFADVTAAHTATNPLTLKLENNRITDIPPDVSWAGIQTCSVDGNPLTFPAPSQCAAPAGNSPNNSPNNGSNNSPAVANFGSGGTSAGVIAAAVVVPIVVLAVLGFVGFRHFKRRRGYTYKNDDEVPNISMLPVAVSRDTADEWNPTKFHFVIRGLWTTLNAVYVGVWGAAPESAREEIPQSIPSWGQAAGLPYAMATNPQGYTPRIVKEWVFFRAIGQVLVTYIFNQTEPVTQERITELVQAQARELFGVDAPADTVAAFATKCIELETAIGSRPGGVQAYLPSAGEEFNDDKHEAEDERGGQSIIGLLPGFIENKSGTVYHKAKVCFVA